MRPGRRLIVMGVDAGYAYADISAENREKHMNRGEQADLRHTKL